jgi:hypothetical protein
MKMDDLRPLMGRGIIAMGLCFGGYSLLVAPSERKLSQVRAEIAAAKAEIAAGQLMMGHGDEIAGNLRNVQTQVASMDERSRRARDERELFDAITALAEKHHVTVQQLTPLKNIAARTSSAATPGAPAAPAATGAPTAAPGSPLAKGPQDLALGYAISFTCDYRDLVRLVNGLEHDIGYALVTSVRAAPVMEIGSTHVQGEIAVEFYSLDAAPPADPTIASADAAPKATEAPR